MSIEDKSEIINNESTPVVLQNMDENEKELHLQAESDFKKKQFGCKSNYLTDFISKTIRKIKTLRGIMF